VADGGERAAQDHAEPGESREPAFVGEQEELPPQRLAGPPQQRLHGVQLELFLVGDALVGPALVLPHGEDLAVAIREPVEGGPEQDGVGLGVEQLVGRDAGVGHGPEGLVVARLDTEPLAEDVGAHVAGDGVEPGVDVAPVAEGVEGPPGPKERLLGRVGGVVGVAEARAAEAHEPLAMAVVERGEGPEVAGLGGPDQVDVDVVALEGGASGGAVEELRCRFGCLHRECHREIFRPELPAT
jgi:hypothetical protein